MNFDIPAGSEVKFEHLNIRTERHGETDVTACDLKLAWETGNTVLQQFHPDLLEALYAPEDSKQKKVAGVPPVCPVRIFTALKPLKWDGVVTARKLTIDYGLGGGSDLVIPDAMADSFVISPLEGGTVVVTMRVAATCEDEHVLGRLPMLLKRTLPMRLEAMPDRADDDRAEAADTAGVSNLTKARQQRRSAKTPEEAFTGSPPD